MFTYIIIITVFIVISWLINRYFLNNDKNVVEPFLCDVKPHIDDNMLEKRKKPFDNLCLTDKPYANTLNKEYSGWKVYPEFIHNKYIDYDRYGFDDKLRAVPECLAGNKEKFVSTNKPCVECLDHTHKDYVDNKNTYKIKHSKEFYEYCEKNKCKSDPGYIDPEYYHNPYGYCKRNPGMFPCPNWWVDGYKNITNDSLDFNSVINRKNKNKELFPCTSKKDLKNIESSENKRLIEQTHRVL